MDDKSKGSGDTFAEALGFHNKDKEIEDQLKPLPESNGEYQKYLDQNIQPVKTSWWKRPGKEEYYLDMAQVASTRATCLRRRFGAVIVKDDVIISTGYNGSSRHRKNCSDLKFCLRQKLNVPPGQRYELCRSVHAEANAIMNADPESRKDATMYLVGIEISNGAYVDADCCSMCKRMVLNSGIKRVVFMNKNGYTWRTVDVIEEWGGENDDSLSEHEGY